MSLEHLVSKKMSEHWGSIAVSDFKVSLLHSVAAGEALMLGEIQGKYASSACQAIEEDEFDFNPECGVSLDIACNVQCHHRTTCRSRLPLARGKFGA